MTARAFLPAFSASLNKPSPDASRLLELCEIIVETYRRSSEQTAHDLAVLAATYMQRLHDDNWDGATEADIAALTRAVCTGTLNEFDELREFLLVQAARTRRPNVQAAMCEGYFEGWLQDEMLTGKVAKIISEAAEHLPRPFAKIVSNLPEVLDVPAGAIRLAQRMTAQDKPYTWLISCGFPDPQSIGFLEEVSNTFLASLPAVRDRKAMDRLMGWCRPDEAIGLQGDQQIAAIDHLLRPWVNDDPQKEDRQHITEFLVHHFGDPRTAGANIWTDVDPTCHRVMLRWLAGDSIVAFMDVISTVEQQNGVTWRMRREFWTRLYDEGTVTEAWVALHPAAEKEARRRFEETGDTSLKAFGRQSGKRRDTSLLIMCAGDRVIVEGSHTYRVHVFDHDTIGRPQLYLSEYFDEHITLPRENKQDTNWHDQPGHWRDWVRERLQ